MTLRHSLTTGLALGLTVAAGLPACAQNTKLPDPIEQKVQGLATAITANPNGDKGEALFAASRRLEELLFPDMWNNAVGTVPAGPPLAIVRIYPGDNINDLHVIIPGPGAAPVPPDPNNGVFPEFLVIQLGPGSDCVWRTLSTGDRVKICR